MIKKLVMCPVEVYETQQEVEMRATVIQIQDLAILSTNQFVSLKKSMFVSLKHQTK